MVPLENHGNHQAVVGVLSPTVFVDSDGPAPASASSILPSSERTPAMFVLSHNTKVWVFDKHDTAFLGFPCGSVGKESTCNVEDLGSIPGLLRSPGEGKGYPLQPS